MKESQIIIDEAIIDFVKKIKIKSPNDLLILKEKINKHLKFLPYKGNELAESKLRWTRTSSEIFLDGFVYKGKACSDLVVLFIACCKAMNIEAKLVRLPGHSIAEAKIDNEWYVIDAGGSNEEIKKGIFPDNHPDFKGRGQDFWEWQRHNSVSKL